jgi:uncharacterized 2Fe-2S/4Fe-4S cluster protein (DUF4445 family)
VQDNVRVILSPIVVYSNKSFRSSYRYRDELEVPLGLAIDLGTTTVAAFLTMLDNGEVCRGAATLNQQTVFGADVISRMNNAGKPGNASRIQKLAIASIIQSIDALKLSEQIRNRIQRIVIVGNVAMHHLITKRSLETLQVYPFQPESSDSIKDGNVILGGIFPSSTEVLFPPLIGGFVGSDALSCLAYFGFDNPGGPMAAIDLGTNGEVMVTDGRRIVTASTAAGPAFEGVQISCGTRAVDGAVTSVQIEDGEVILETIADETPIGLTGSGLLCAVYELIRTGVIEGNGRILAEGTSPFPGLVGRDDNGVMYVKLNKNGSLRLTQWDIRELQKAKGAILAAIIILMKELGLTPEDLEKVYLTGSFGGQVDINAVIGIGMLPAVNVGTVETVANGAGLGAAMFLGEEGFELGEKLAKQAEQIDLDANLDFQNQFVKALELREWGIRSW